MRIAFDPKRLETIYAALERFRLEAQANIRGRVLPPVVKSGIRYKRETRRQGDPENWQLPLTLLRTKRGDCEDIATYECVRLRAAGFNCSVLLQAQGGGLYHAVVVLPNGKVYDPCLGVGMDGGD